MNAEEIRSRFIAKMHTSIEVEAEGIDRFRVHAPIYFDDGDELIVALTKRAGNWVLTDEGHTFMRLTYDIESSELTKGTRAKVIQDALAIYGLKNDEGRLNVEVTDDHIADAFYSLVQGILRISDVSLLSRERVASTFMQDLQQLITSSVGESRVIPAWHEPKRDPEALYPVDWRIGNDEKPLFVFALPNDDKVQVATIALHTFEKWGIAHESIGIFEDQESISRKHLARFSDVCDKQFSNLYTNRERIASYIADAA